MDLWLLIQAVILGVVEGLTEFLPVSSTGHLIVVGELLNFNDEKGKVFEMIIQFGAILGVVWHYRARVARLFVGLRQKQEQRFAFNLFLAFLPAAVVGLFFHKQIQTYLFGAKTVAAALIVGGILILIIERLPLRARINNVDDVRPMDALKIGIAQTFSLFPGVSRAGATIMGGLLTGLSRTAATEFSFYLAMPTMLAVFFFQILKNHSLLHAADLPVFAVGFIVSFVSALVVVRAFLKFVSGHDFTVFAYYRIGFGVLVLMYFW